MLRWDLFRLVPGILFPAMATVWLLSCLGCLIGLAATSQFQGAIIQWRPVDAVQFDGRVSYPHTCKTFCSD